MMIYKIFAVYFLTCAFLLTAPNVLAARPRVKKQSVTTSTAVTYSKAKLSRSTNSLIVTFVNLTNVSKISYTLMYTANGIDKGDVGSLTPTGTTESRDFYFGTCSHGVCTPHYNIRDASLLIETTLKNGRVNTKRYLIKI
jgi:hypothetical protein